jgi:hypothetical protein
MPSQVIRGLELLENGETYRQAAKKADISVSILLRARRKESITRPI